MADHFANSGRRTVALLGSAGEVVVSRYAKGRKVAAFREDAGDVNEKHLTVVRRPDGETDRRSVGERPPIGHATGTRLRRPSL